MWRYLYTGDVWKLMTHQLNPMERMLFIKLSTENLIYFHHVAPSKHQPALPYLLL
ncbi:hypothetical protein ABVT39_019522 [Epinephelus coioides]